MASCIMGPLSSHSRWVTDFHLLSTDHTFLTCSMSSGLAPLPCMFSRILRALNANQWDKATLAARTWAQIGQSELTSQAMQFLQRAAHNDVEGNSLTLIPCPTRIDFFFLLAITDAKTAQEILASIDSIVSQVTITVAFTLMLFLFFSSY